MGLKPVIHVIDDDAELRTALLRLLDAAGHDARGYASTGDFLLHPLAADHAGCLLLDIHLPGPSGLDLQEVLHQHGCMLPVVFLTGRADVHASVRAMKAGAVDFLEKPVQRPTLLAALERALAKDAAQHASREAASRLHALFAQLDARERKVFDQVASGRLNKQIAQELQTSERTVKALRAQLMLKLGAASAADLGALAERLRRAGDGPTSETSPRPSAR